MDFLHNMTIQATMQLAMVSLLRLGINATPGVMGPGGHANLRGLTLSSSGKCGNWELRLHHHDHTD